MIISLSILDVEKDKIKESIENFNNINKDNYLHFDIMDGEFVENKSFDFNLLKEINEYSTLFKDVHLMVTNPLDKINDYIKSGANQITFHYEAVDKNDLYKIITAIKNKNVKVGMSIKPSTKIKEIFPLLGLLDYFLLMSVNPGKGGQQFIEDTFKRLKLLVKFKKKYNLNLNIAVDGGVNPTNSIKLKKLGANTIIVGSYLLKNGINKENINKLIDLN